MARKKRNDNDSLSPCTVFGQRRILESWRWNPQVLVQLLSVLCTGSTTMHSNRKFGWSIGSSCPCTRVVLSRIAETQPIFLCKSCTDISTSGGEPAADST